jgi:purine catabolism regulator
VGALTAREVLALLERHSGQLVAGVSGLRRPVTWAVTMRPRPPAFETLDGGELALLSLSVLRTLRAQDDSLTLARLIQDLADHNVAMIAVAGVLPSEAPTIIASGSALARPADAEECALATALNLPLVALPARTPLAEIEREVLAAVRRSSAEREADEDLPRSIYDALLRASLRGEDDRALGSRMAALLNVAVVLEDDEGVEWSAVPASFPVSQEALVALVARPSARSSLRMAVAEGAAGQTLSVGRDLVRRFATLDIGPDRTSNAPDDWGPSGDEAPDYTTNTPGEPTSLSLIFAAAEADRADVLSSTLELAGPLFALAVARRRDLTGVERRLRTEVLDALLSGTYGNEAQMTRRAAQLGHDLSLVHVATAVELDVGSAAHRAALATVLDEAPGAWIRSRDGEVVALIPVSESIDSAGLAANLQERLTRALGGEGWSAGLGQPGIGPADMRRSYGEARDAARLGRQVLGPGRCALPADLGVCRLLLRLRGGSALEEFIQSTVGPLLADRRSGEALLETLDVFFACNGNVSEAARRLHLQRNSMIYRLNRARELLGRDLEDAEVRLSLQLALKARRVLEQ